MVSFLTTIDKRLDEDGQGKLKRVLKYLKVNKYMKLTFRVDYLSVVRWFVYASSNKMSIKGAIQVS